MKRVLAAFAIIAALLVSPAIAGDNLKTSAQPLATGTANAALSFDLQANETVMGGEITGLTAAGATLTVEGSTDGRRQSDPSKVWFATVGIPFTCPSPSTFTTITADGQFKVDVSGLTNIRIRVSSTGTGTALVSLNAIPAATLGSCGGTGGGSSGGSVNIHDSAGNVLNSTGGALNVAGTFSATLGGFTPSSSGARMSPLTVQLTTSSQTLPTGAVTVVDNTDATNPIFCNVNGVAATIADKKIAANSWFAFTIPATITTLNCIATGAPVIANGVGGAGLPTGAGGGGGSGSGGVVSQPTASLLNATVVGGSGAPLATSANQEVTAAGTSATSAQGIQGVTGGVPQPTIAGPNVTTVSPTPITTADVGQTCTSTGWGNQTACTGTPTPGSAYQVAITSAGYIWVQANTTSGTPTVNLVIRISNDGGTTWFNRGIFEITNTSPFQINGITSLNWAGWITGGVTNVEVVASTYTGSGSTNITVTQGQATPFTTSSATSSSANGTASTAATNIQGNGPTATPVGTNLQQIAATTLAAPTATGVAPAGGALVQNVNAAITGGSVTASFGQWAPNGNNAQLTVGASSSSVALPSGTVVTIDNTGSNTAFFHLGVGSATATAADTAVPSGGFKCVTVGSNTFLGAIETAGATALNINGGAGGCAGAGGGGGGSASGNVFQANIFSITNNGGTGATTQVVAASGSLTIYLINYSFQGAAAAGTFQIVSGTGSNCATGQAPLTALWDLSTAATGGEGPIGVLAASAPGAEVCIKTTGSNNTSWRAGFAQQ